MMSVGWMVAVGGAILIHGYELYADEPTVDDEPFQWSLTGNCAYAGDFDYASPS